MQSMKLREEVDSFRKTVNEMVERARLKGVRIDAIVLTIDYASPDEGLRETAHETFHMEKPGQRTHEDFGPRLHRTHDRRDSGFDPVNDIPRHSR